MSVFVCSNESCLTIDNTALAPGYWASSEPPLCTVCVAGKWHDKFPQERYNKYKHGPITGTGRMLVLG